MIPGYALVVFGYAIFYWGIHHFPGVDCETQDGCRYSLWDVMGIPSSWEISHGTPIQIQPGPDKQQNPATSPSTTQPQSPSNNKTPSKPTTPSKTPAPVGCWNLVQLPNYGGWAWKNSKTGQVVSQISPPTGGKICAGSKKVSPPSAGGATPGLGLGNLWHYVAHGGAASTVCGWIPGCRAVFNG